MQKSLKIFTVNIWVVKIMKNSINDVLYTQLNHCTNLIQRLQSSKYQQLPQGQGKILRILSRHGVVSQKRIAECMQIRSPSVTELVLKLEAKGYVERSADTDDRRVYNISLTDKGRQEALLIENINKKLFEEFFSNLDDAEKKILSELLCKTISFSKHESKGCNFCKECGICSMGYKKLIDS